MVIGSVILIEKFFQPIPLIKYVLYEGTDVHTYSRSVVIEEFLMSMLQINWSA